MLFGEYHPNLDDKGRLMVPVKVRSAIVGNATFLTRGADRCLWLFPPEVWLPLRERLIATLSTFKKPDRSILQRFVAPAQEAEIDRTGRIAVPQALRKVAGLRKECIMLGVGKHMEIWARDAYESYLEETDDSYSEAMAATLGEIIL